MNFTMEEDFLFVCGKGKIFVFITTRVGIYQFYIRIGDYLHEI